MNTLQYEIPVPKEAGIDIPTIYVLTSPAGLEDFVKKQPLADGKVLSGVGFTDPYDPVTFNKFIYTEALRVQANLAVLNKNSVQFYRVNESKKAGREFPGVGVGVIQLNDDYLDTVVLTLRAGTSNNRKGKWGLTGGTKELGDDLIKTVKEEVNQETNTIVEVLGCIDITEDMPEGQDWISFGFVAKEIGGEFRNNEPHKFDAVERFHLDDLPSNVSDLTARIIMKYKTNPTKYIKMGRITE